MKPRIVSKEQFNNMTSKEVCGDAWTGPQVEDKGKIGTLELTDGQVVHPICGMQTSPAGPDGELISIDRTWYDGNSGHLSNVRWYFSANPTYNSFSNESPLTRLKDVLQANPNITNVSSNLWKYITQQEIIWNNMSEC